MVIGIVLLVVVAGVLALAAGGSIGLLNLDQPDNAPPLPPSSAPASPGGDEAMCREAVTLLGEVPAGEGQSRELGRIADTLDAQYPGRPATEALTGYLRVLADAVSEGEVTESGLAELRRLREEFLDSSDSQPCDALGEALPADSGRPAPGAS